jgi:ribosome assembly protein YihI (activator of Der GTPase)
MPKVNGKSYPYTTAGQKAAAIARKKNRKKRKKGSKSSSKTSARQSRIGYR